MKSRRFLSGKMFGNKSMPSFDEELREIATAKASTGAGAYYILFFLSGFPALLYQVVWQRALFTIYGINIESVTVIVSVFMLGLGIGSLAGGRLSVHAEVPLLLVFGAIESGIAVYGVFSLKLFHAIAGSTAGISTFQTGIVTMTVLLLPTTLMGSTLPLLTAHLVRTNRNVGESLGSLYAVNTFGSAAACFAAAHFLMGRFGESGTIRIAAIWNGCIALSAFMLFCRRSAPPVWVKES